MFHETLFHETSFMVYGGLYIIKQPNCMVYVLVGLKAQHYIEQHQTFDVARQHWKHVSERRETQLLATSCRTTSKVMATVLLCVCWA